MGSRPGYECSTRSLGFRSLSGFHGELRSRRTRDSGLLVAADATGERENPRLGRSRRARMARGAGDLLDGVLPMAERLRLLRESRSSHEKGRQKQDGVPSGIRTRVIAVKGRCPRPG